MFLTEALQHTLQHQGRAGQPHAAKCALKGTLKITYMFENVLHSFWPKPTKIISEFQELELGNQFHRTIKCIQWVVQLNNYRFQPFWIMEMIMLTPGKFGRWKEEKAMRLVPLPADHQWSFTSWKVKVFFWNPKRKDFKTVRWCQKPPVLRGRKSYQLLFQKAGEKVSNKLECLFSENHVFFNMNCENTFLLTFLLLGDTKALYALSSSFIV